MRVGAIISITITVIFGLSWVAHLGLPLAGTLIPGHLDDPELEKEYENKIHRLVNEERIKHGLAPLAWNERVADVARLHSTDMMENAFFDHVNPRGQSVTDRYIAARVSCNMWGENIFLEYAVFPGSSNAHSIVAGWMDSSGHRANILNNGFSSQGIGVAVDLGKVYATQNFC